MHLAVPALRVVPEAARAVPHAKPSSWKRTSRAVIWKGKDEVGSCRPTVLTMGMVATQRTEGMFGVAKNSGIHKKLSLCGLWDKLQLLYKKMDVEYCRWFD